MEINQERLWNRLHQLGEIGADPQGGLTRLAYTDLDMQARALVMQFMEEAGLQVHEDAVGNVIGVYNPGVSEDAPILSGSHFDTVRNAGIFDGCLGILAAVEAAETLKENQVVLNRPFCVVGYRDEEGNRFGSGMIGSKTIAGKAVKEDFAAKDENGISIEEAMRHCGYHPENYKDAKISPYASVELHIEQGKVLEQFGCSVGIVEGIPYLRLVEVTISGCSGHAGATPMNDRLDPVLAMTRWIQKITELAGQIPYTVATVGSIRVFPGSTNVIADHVSFALDIRSLEEQNIDGCLQAMQELEAELRTQGFAIEYSCHHNLSGVECDPRLKDQLESIMQKRSLPYRRLMSGAGHDSQNFRGVCPCSMIFVRSKDGHSHRKEEFTSKADCGAGAAVLLDMLVQLGME